MFARSHTPAPFEALQRRSGRAIVLELRGELDTTRSKGLSRAVGKLPKLDLERLVLDLRNLDFIDSSGLGCVLELLSLARRKHFELSVLDAPGQVRDALRRSGIEGALPRFARPAGGPRL